MPGGRTGMICFVCKVFKLTRVEIDWAIPLHVPICCCETVESLYELIGRILQTSASYNEFKRLAMLIVLENFFIRKHCQAMPAPTGIRLVAALTRHFDKALPKSLDKNRNCCSALITECNRDRILLELMEPQHIYWSLATRAVSRLTAVQRVIIANLSD
jgi:hypothetical protein